MITTIVFDYGRVLAYPRTGNWFITKNTKKILGMTKYIRLLFNYRKMSSAFCTAQKYLDDNHLLHTEQEEYLQFIEFYKIFLSEMGFKKDMTFICKNLANDIVYNDDKVAFYSDINKLKEFKKAYGLVILSDTWPSLKRILNNKGILPILDGLIMSCEYGETKSDTKLFEIAISELKLLPSKCVFVDDCTSNLDNAKKAGFNVVLMQRNGEVSNSNYPIAKNLEDVKKFILKNNSNSK